MGRPPHLGRRLRRRLCVVCFCSCIILYYECLWIFLIYSVYIYIFPKYFPYVSLCITTINVFSKTCDFVKRSWTCSIKKYDSIKIEKFANRNQKGVISEGNKKKNPLCWLALAGPGMSKFRILVKFRALRVQN